MTDVLHPTTLKLNTIEEGITAIRAGKVIIVVDDEDRENEGDFICAAECITPEIINFMATYGRGLICTPIEESRAQALNLNMMVSSNTAMHETAFTVSVDLIGQGCSTGISAYDRSTGIKHLINPQAKAADFARPGHIFPLRAKSGGVLRRTGHTEAAVDLARMAGFYPAGVLVEILNPDGTMARLPQLVDLAQRMHLKIISIDDLVAYRMANERLVKQEMHVKLPSKYGDLEVFAYRQLTSDDLHLAIKKGTWTADESVPVRVHSNTEDIDILSILFDNSDKTCRKAFDLLQKFDKGLFLWMHQSEKELTLLDRLKLYQQRTEQTTPHADAMGQKDYGIGAQILRDLGIKKIKLITNHPKRRVGLIGYGLEITDNIAL
jgi:3,4-dihydroxy 2-butanone 4-phosphate synthase / GTP cyclohydrolase II